MVKDTLTVEITADDYECNTCGDTGRWETTFEEAPTVLVDIGACPDCDLEEEYDT